MKGETPAKLWLLVESLVILNFKTECLLYIAVDDYLVASVISVYNVCYYQLMVEGSSVILEVFSPLLSVIWENCDIDD